MNIALLEQRSALTVAEQIMKEPAAKQLSI